jgi:2-dehydropantoate 2-reductase
LDILIYGAGVLGSLYAARLQQSGQNVSVLARGQRLNDIRAHGLVLEDGLTGSRTTTHVNTVDRLAPEDAYDLVVVLMGKHQVASILPALATNSHTPNVLFMHNSAAGPDELTAALGRARAMLGFPGAGGTLQGHVVRYLLISQQPTMLGEVDGSTTPRLRQLVSAFKEAGLPVAISPNMGAWLKTHAVFITGIESAIHLAGGRSDKLAQRRDLLALMVNAIREGFQALQALHIPVIPFKLRVMFMWMPRSFAINYWQRELKGKLGELSLSPHANAAPGEIKQLIGEIRTLIRAASVPTPALDRLYGFMDSIPDA